MASPSYLEPRLAALYDALNAASRDDWDFYLSLAEGEALRVIDVGCGTGVLASLFAARGHRVTGVDPAPAMLDIARRRAGGERVHWLQASAAHIDTEERFDLVVMSGHAFQTLLDDSELSTALAGFHRLLAPAGRVAFETRNPRAREWETWVADEVDRVRTAAGALVEVCYQTTAVAGERVTYEIRFRFPGEDTTVATDTLRFLDQPALARLLAGAGFEAITWYGDWDRSPLSATSPEIIVVAKRDN